MAIGVGDEERRGIALVVAKALDDFLFDVKTLTGLDGDNAVFADFIDDLGDEFADFGVASGDSGDLGDFFVVALDFFGDFINTAYDFGAGFFDAFS